MLRLIKIAQEANQTTGLFDKIGIPAWIMSIISLEFLHIDVSDLEYTNQVVKLIIQLIILIIVAWRAYKLFKKG